MTKICPWEFEAWNWIYHKKNNECLADNKIENEIEQLLLKYTHGNNIHEHGKQKNEWTK